METGKVVVGGLLLAASSLTLVEIGALVTGTSLYLAAGLFVTLSIGSLLADWRRHDRPA